MSPKIMLAIEGIIIIPPNPNTWKDRLRSEVSLHIEFNRFSFLVLPYWPVFLSDKEKLFRLRGWGQSLLQLWVTIDIHPHLQLFGHLPPEFKKRTAKVTFPRAHALADVASAVTNSTENKMFREQSRFKNTMKTLRHLMGVQLSFILPPVEQTIEDMYFYGGMRRWAGEMPTMKRYATQRKSQPSFVPWQVKTDH